MTDASLIISNAIFILFLAGIPLYGFIKKVSVYDQFVIGAKDGFSVAVQIIPYLVAIMVAVNMFRASGALDLLTGLLPESLKSVGIGPEILSLILIRPFSGSAALGLLGQIISTHGPESYEAKLGAVILGSTETTFYVLAVYFGSVAVIRTRYAVHAGLAADLAGAIAALVVSRFFFA